ncbi:hypothetical protein [Shinella sp. DD12]|uniref:hypothetical protein n=1 Tax=Shinella sp. DD12 TaxID=1410620 RepID=UPI0004379DEA|nr:hypothetical protein [Shinella sp. DD12]EYR77652.1 hypothetical protein SHLA_65c000050 [Shinella sp. DD12]
MELLFTLGGLIALAIVLYLFMSQRGKRLSWRVKCLILSVLVALLAALWCVIYGPDLWVLIQAGTLIVAGTIASFLSARKE